ncbi:hypothetical protein EZJ55_16250 [Microcystis aeruginosa EAWAG127a]|uniref:Uncharacterized protein n=1 Tax=Microcystis aeruginosa EAWAG127a TaxID=2529855 RepID=A0A5J5LW59_MICAE|nr:hypothetical protein EZJ55_16250 [Microcystis aeruginosa EAWAG127a]
MSYCGAVCRIRLCVHLCLEVVEADWLSYSLCDKFNLYSSDRSLCPLCLCGSFHSLPQDCILEYILPTKPKRAADFRFCYN